jgi:hypothetical protein
LRVVWVGGWVASVCACVRVRVCFILIVLLMLVWCGRVVGRVGDRRTVVR